MTWPLTRVDRVATVNARIGWRALTADEYTDEGYIFLSTPNIKGTHIDFAEVNYIPEFRYRESPELMLRLGDVLLAKDGSTLGITALVDDLPAPATVNGSIAVIRPFAVESRFLRYALASDPTQRLIRQLKDGMGVPHLFQWDIRRLPVPVPPIEEQRRIADFLDDQVTRISQLVDLRRRELALAAERSRSNLDAATRASGPSRRLKYIVQEVTARVGYEPDPRELLSVSIHLGVVPRAEIADSPSRAESLASYKCVRPGDLVLNRMRAFQGAVGVASTRGVVSPDYTVLRPLSEQVSSRFLNHLFRSPWFVAEMTARLRGIGGTDQGAVRTPRVNVDDLLDTVVPLPARIEQDAVASELDKAFEALGKVQRALAESLSLLEERKRALITAAVAAPHGASVASWRTRTLQGA